MEVNTTEDTVLEPIPNRQYLIPGIAVVSIIILSIIVTLLANANTPSNNGTIVDTDNTASFPISNTVVTNTSIEFANEETFTKTSLTSLNNDNCSRPEFEGAVVDINSFVHTNTENSLLKAVTERDAVYTSVVRNGLGVDVHPSYPNLKEAVDMLLNDQYDGGDSIKPIGNFFGISCGDPFFMKAVDLVEKIEYPGTDSAYMIVSHGSPQAVPSKVWMPVQISFIFKVGSDYGHSTIHLESYDSITSVNNLVECEEQINNEVAGITDDVCVKNLILRDLDRQELDSIKNEWLSVFALD